MLWLHEKQWFRKKIVCLPRNPPTRLQFITVSNYIYIIYLHLYYIFCTEQYYFMLRPRKKKTLFYGPNKPRFFHFGIFLFCLLKSCEISRFWPKSKKIWPKIIENNWKYFSTIFLQKCQSFLDFCVLRRSFLCCHLDLLWSMKYHIHSNKLPGHLDNSLWAST